jgi:hypothetical protein
MAGLTNTISNIIAIPIMKKVHETSSSLTAENTIRNLHTLLAFQYF